MPKEYYFCDNEQCPNHILVDFRTYVRGQMNRIDADNQQHQIRRFEYTYRHKKEMMSFCSVCHNAVNMCKSPI